MVARKKVTGAAAVAALSLVEQTLSEEERRPQPARVSGWRDFLREAARAGARLLRAEPAWTAGLGFGAEELAAGPRRLQELEEAREALAARLTQLDNAIVLHKQQITQRTRRLHAAVAHKLADPTLPPEARLRLLGESAALRRAFERHAERQEHRRQRSLRERRALAAAREEAQIAVHRPIPRQEASEPASMLDPELPTALANDPAPPALAAPHDSTHTQRP